MRSGRARAVAVLVALALTVACSSEEHRAPPASAPHPMGPPPGPPPGWGGAPGSLRPPAELAGEVITRDDIAALTTGTPAARRKARAQIADALASGRAQVLVFEADEYLSVAPHLAPSVLHLDPEARRALAELSGDAGEEALEKARAAGDVDALAQELARYPFARTAPAAMHARAEFLVERGELDEALLALGDAFHMDDLVVSPSLPEKAAAMKRLREKAGGRRTLGPLGPPKRASGIVLIGRWHGLTIAEMTYEKPLELGTDRDPPIKSVLGVGEHGETRWRQALPDDCASVAGLYAGRVVVIVRMHLGGGLCSIDASTGRVLWLRFQCRTPPEAEDGPSHGCAELGWNGIGFTGWGAAYSTLDPCTGR